MRIVLYTGKGGVGKTCVSAAAALAAAGRGQRTVVLSSDRAHSLGDAFQVPLGPDPVEVAPNLEALEVDANAEIEKHWGEIQDWLRRVLTSQGTDGFRADEVALFPGLEELCTLLRVKDFWDNRRYDAVVVDCAPTGATLRLLSFPEAFSWYIRRIFPLQRAAMGIARPAAGWALSFPLPPDQVFAAIKDLHQRLAGITDVLFDPQRAGVRLVTIPENMAYAETRRAFAEFSLYGLCVEAVIVNRVLPEEISDPYLQPMKEGQREWLARIEADFSPLTIMQARLFSEEVAGLEALVRLADHLFGEQDPMAPLRTEAALRIEERDGVTRLLLAAPFAAREDVELLQRGDELVVELGGSRRNLLLPGALARMQAKQARVENGTLAIDFVRTSGGPEGG